MACVSWHLSQLWLVTPLAGTYQLLPCHAGWCPSPAAVTQEKAKDSSSSSLLVQTQKERTKLGAAFLLHPKDGQKRSTL